MTIEIKTRADGYPNYTLEQELDGRVYIFDVYWNEREEFYYFDLLDETGDPIQTGIKMVIDFPLLGRVTDSRRPSGEIVAVDQGVSGLEAGLYDLGNRVQLVYEDGT